MLDILLLIAMICFLLSCRETIASMPYLHWKSVPYLKLKSYNA